MKIRLFDRVVSFIRTGYFGSKSFFVIDVGDSIRYLNLKPEPHDDIDRSYYQYLCQCYLRRKIAIFLFNIASFFVVIPYVIKGLCGKISFKEPKDILYTISIMDKGIIPSSLKKEYTNEIITNEYDGTLLKMEDLRFIWKVYKRHPFSFFFLFRIIIKISFYRYFIEEYHPKAIAINAEYSSASSVMTAYCEQLGIMHYNIMHGEKLLYIRDSFFRFTRCYVWDKYYENLFVKLRACKGQFVIERPNSLSFNVEQMRGSLPMIDYKYMLNGNEKLAGISKSLDLLRDKGFKVMVRPHPAYSDMEIVKRYFKESEIESISISIEESLSNTKNVISLYSTVLLQAYFSNIQIVMDDVNYEVDYLKLKDLEYILINKKHQKLSEIL